MREALLTVSGEECLLLERDWWGLWARGNQVPPEGHDWHNWLLLGGRGAGKTRAGAEWVKAMAMGTWGQRAPNASHL